MSPPQARNRGRRQQGTLAGQPGTRVCQNEHIVKRSDWALLAIAAMGKSSMTPVQLQKVLFIVGREMLVGTRFYKFSSYNYGPFSADIYADTETLEAAGLIQIEQSGPGRPWRVFRATAEGQAMASEVRETAPKATVKYLDAVVAWARGLSFQELVSSVYKRYPEQRANSIFVEPAGG